MTNLAANLARTVKQYADHVAIRLDDATLTYAQLDDASARLASYLRAQGVQPGDRVALSLPNVPAFAIVYYGILRSGAVALPMNPLFKPREVEYFLKDAEASLIFGLAGDAQAAAETVGTPFVEVGADQLQDLVSQHEPYAEVVDRADDDTAVILYTSGTTGRPKGAELTHGALNTNQEVTARTLIEVQPDDVLMGCLPLFHVFGMTCGLNTAVANGATLTLIPRFDPAKALEVIARDKVTIFLGVPTMYGAMLAASATVDADLSSLRTCISGGSSMPVEVMRKFEDRFGATILEGYGLSETSPVASFNHPHVERKAGSIGTPIEGVEMRLAGEGGAEVPAGEIGEIAIRGHLLMKGYWKRPDATAEAIRDGWFYSGDLARLDEDGYYFIVDRSKDLIIRGGYNVYPREVEEVLYEHPDVVEAAVVGVPHDHYGEEIKAYVVLGPDATATPEDLQAFTKERVAPYKYPRTIELIEALPKGPSGKILKRELRDAASPQS
ncbi:long-chain-fatty-acid--CoA ligase [Luteipulveratus mongoliensis]|uniref:AMP-dependent synthetase n=1 Tax=Luteipulveratus mongoliensis TaxID=571913 RepID=A0A0K1JDL5_9MICO|nr:long-chain fatty acid--CoA ligase [Luteipulveratus mongoliensis]AKU14789.1 hypothetical protein VV02_01060 [Luteipulveratus mongoliensis]